MSAGARCAAAVALFNGASGPGALSLQQWDLVIRQLRRAGLLARLRQTLADQGRLEDVPRQVRHHLESAWVASQALQRSVRWEVRCIAGALAKLEIPVVFLKGAAYVLAEARAGQGRVFTDVDIMVPRDALEDVERRLLIDGWVPAKAHRNEYDQRYYRRWMHELPPFQHVKRQTVLDVHHRILPLTARLQPDPERMFGDARLIPGAGEAVHVLSPADMILHSAAHLFHEGEFQHGLRDLLDIRTLIEEFMLSAEDWERLLERADELDLAVPLSYGLRYGSELLEMAVPGDVMERVVSLAAIHPLRQRLLDRLFRRGLQPDHWSCRSLADATARLLLYVRSHYLRMPLALLLPHLVHKALHREQAE